MRPALTRKEISQAETIGPKPCGDDAETAAGRAVPPLPEVRTQKLAIVDEFGQERIVLALDDSGHSVLTMEDPAGRKRLQVRVDSQGVWLQIGLDLNTRDGASRSVDLVMLDSGRTALEITADGLTMWGVTSTPTGGWEPTCPEAEEDSGGLDAKRAQNEFLRFTRHAAW